MVEIAAVNVCYGSHFVAMKKIGPQALRPKTLFRVGRALRLDKNLLRGSVRIVSNFRMLHKGVNSENVFQNKHSHPPTASQPSSARRAQTVRRVRFQAGSSTPLHLIGVELEKVGDLFSFPKPGRFMLYYPPKRKD